MSMDFSDGGLPVGDLVVGCRYKVELQDCCIVGDFTATLVEKRTDEHDRVSEGVRQYLASGVSEYPADDEYEPDVLAFDNDVTLTLWDRCVFTEAR